MKYLNVLTKKEFTDAQGIRKAVYYKAGYVKEAQNGSRYMVLFNQPDTVYCLFEDTHDGEEQE
jgi:hypothetical protein